MLKVPVSNGACDQLGDRRAVCQPDAAVSWVLLLLVIRKWVLLCTSGLAKAAVSPLGA